MQWSAWQLGDKSNRYNSTRPETAASILRSAVSMNEESMKTFINKSDAIIFGLRFDVNEQSHPHKPGLDCVVNEWNFKAEEITGFKLDHVTATPLLKNFVSEEYHAALQEMLDNLEWEAESLQLKIVIPTQSAGGWDVLLTAMNRRQDRGVVGMKPTITYPQCSSKADVVNVCRDPLCCSGCKGGFRGSACPGNRAWPRCIMRTAAVQGSRYRPIRIFGQRRICRN